MVELDHRDRTISVKPAYCGPPVAGKTTKLQILHRSRWRGELVSIFRLTELPQRDPGDATA